jgi:hypothetical protein
MTESHGHGKDPAGGPGTDREIDYRAVWRFTAFILGLIVVCMALMWVLSRFLKNEIAGRQPAAPPLAGARENPLPPAPRLETSPAKDLADLREREAAVLSAYAWVDKAKGIAEVPVDRAIEIAAERGLPVKYGPPPSATAAPAGGTGK